MLGKQAAGQEDFDVDRFLYRFVSEAENNGLELEKQEHRGEGISQLPVHLAIKPFELLQQRVPDAFIRGVRREAFDEQGLPVGSERGPPGFYPGDQVVSGKPVRNFLT